MKKDELIHIGGYTLKKKRIGILLRFCKYAFAEEYQQFLLQNELSSLRSSDEKSLVFLEEIFTKYEDKLLWFYEGEYVYNRSLRLLQIRPRSRKELIDFLHMHTDNEKSIPAIMAKLELFIDDEKFAEYLVQKERSHNPKGDRIIKAKLQEKGIDASIIDHFLEKDPEEQARFIEIQYNKKKDALMRKVEKRDGGYKQKEFEMKMKQYLLSKGFLLSDIDAFFKTIS